MSKPGETPNNSRIVELKAAAHLMALDAGIFCVYHAPNQAPAGQDGLPGVRISEAPGSAAGNVSIKTFEADGWLGASSGAALIRVLHGPAQVLVTTYQVPGSIAESPRLQVVQLAAAAAASVPVAAPVPVAPAEVSAPVAAAPASKVVGKAAETAVPATGVDGKTPQALPNEAEIAAHIQRRGDVLSRIGEWMGTPGCQFWIEGFGVAPNALITAEDIEYQAVLGKDWLSPWSEGGQYCGSRGMALPILGLRVRLKGDAAKTYAVRVTATFTDGTKIGPVDSETAAEAESLAPLEAFLLELVPAGEVVASKPAVKKAGKAPAARKAPVAKAAATKVAPKAEVPTKAAAPAAVKASAPARKPATKRAPKKAG